MLLSRRRRLSHFVLVESFAACGKALNQHKILCELPQALPFDPAETQSSRLLAVEMSEARRASVVSRLHNTNARTKW